MVCHYCNASVDVRKGCPACGGGIAVRRGAGTQAVEEELGRLFPGCPDGPVRRRRGRRPGSAAEAPGRLRAAAASPFSSRPASSSISRTSRSPVSSPCCAPRRSSGSRITGRPKTFESVSAMLDLRREGDGRGRPSSRRRRPFTSPSRRPRPATTGLLRGRDRVPARHGLSALHQPGRSDPPEAATCGRSAAGRASSGRFSWIRAGARGPRARFRPHWPGSRTSPGSSSSSNPRSGRRSRPRPPRGPAEGSPEKDGRLLLLAPSAKAKKGSNLLFYTFRHLCWLK